MGGGAPGSLSTAYDSWFGGYKFEPQVGCRAYLKVKCLKKRK